MYCDFQKTEDGPKPWKCTRCGYTYRVAATRGCDIKDPPNIQKTESADIKKIEDPSFGKKLFNFAGAVAKDVATGMQRRTDEEMEEILEICKQCPFYQKIDETHGSCAKCGCPMSRDHVYRNKVAWKSQHCPDKPPRW